MVQGPFKVKKVALAVNDELPIEDRCYDCKNYDLCLNLAAALDWDGFCCTNCDKSVDQKLVWQALKIKKADRVVEELCSELDEKIIAVKKGDVA